MVISLFWGIIDLHSRKKQYYDPELLYFPHSSEYLPLCSAEQTHSYRFGNTWGWVNYDRIFIFGWTIPLSVLMLWSQSIRSLSSPYKFTVEAHELTSTASSSNSGRSGVFQELMDCALVKQNLTILRILDCQNSECVWRDNSSMHINHAGTTKLRFGTHCPQDI